MLEDTEAAFQLSYPEFQKELACPSVFLSPAQEAALALEALMARLECEVAEREPIRCETVRTRLTIGEAKMLIAAFSTRSVIQ